MLTAIALALALARLQSMPPSPTPPGLPPGVGATSTYLVTVAPDGTLAGCRPQAASGWAALDAAGCPALAQARFSPARDSAGAPAHGVLEVAIAWPGGEAVAAPPDLELEVERLPAGLGGRPTATLALEIPAGGAPAACRVVDSAGAPALDGVACASASAAVNAAAGRPAAGPPTPEVRTFRVRFVPTLAWAPQSQARRLADLYPERAQRLGLSGDVVLRCQAAQGEVRDCAVVEESPSGLAFGEAALRIVRVSGMAVKPEQTCEVYVPFAFRLQPGRQGEARSRNTVVIQGSRLPGRGF